MRLNRAIGSVLAGGAVLALAACGGSDGGTKPSGPVTVFPVSYIFGTDTVKGNFTLDGQTITIANDSFVGVARGNHNVTQQLDIEYLPVSYQLSVDPNETWDSVFVDYAGSCRTTPTDASFCNFANRVDWSGSRRMLCLANDFGDFCTGYADPNTVARIGLHWPLDTAATATDGYVSQAKLLIGGIVGNELAAGAGDTVATALYQPGDYGPRNRLRATAGDSSRHQTQVWTDLRHQPFFGFQSSFLAANDRPQGFLGLEVLTTYFMPANQKDALFIRFDVRNISNQAAYRLVHPEVPAGGFTVNQIYLTPVVDANIGAPFLAEAVDDFATMFPAESLVVAYDGDLKVDNFGNAGSRAKPGMVGLRLLSAPAQARGFLAELGDSLTYITNAFEDDTYRMISAGREGLPRAGTGCVDRTVALDCTPAGVSNVVVGWSVGPITSLAPGQSTTLTVALLLARPAGSFASGTAQLPQNDQIGNDSRAIRAIAQTLRALAVAVSNTTVSNNP